MSFNEILPLIHCCSALLHWLIYVTSPPQFTMHSWFCAIQPWVQVKSGFLNFNHIPFNVVRSVPYGRFPKSPELTRNSAVFPKHSRLVLTTQRLSEMELFSLKSFSFIVMLFTCRNCITPRSSLIFAKNKIYIHLRMSSPKYDLDAFWLISSEYL